MPSVSPSVVGGGAGSTYTNFTDEKIIGEYGTVLNGVYLASLTTKRDRMIYVCQINHNDGVVFPREPDPELGSKQPSRRISLSAKDIPPDTIETFASYEKQSDKWLLDRLKEIWKTQKPMQLTNERATPTGFVRWLCNGLTCHSLTSRASVYIVSALYSACLGVFIFLISNMFIEHLSKLFIRQEEDSVTDILGAVTHLAMACAAILGFALFLFSVILLWRVTPRNCNVFGCGKGNAGRRRASACCGSNVRVCRRKRKIFEELMKNDVAYDPNLVALHEFDYDSDKDDPVAAVLYYHLKEAGKISTQDKDKKKV